MGGVSWRLKVVKGKVYLVKEFVDASGRRRARSLGNVEWLERLVEEYRRGLTAGYGGQSNGRNGMRGFRGDGAAKDGAGWKLPLPDPNQFREWLTSARGVSPETADSYTRYLSTIRTRHGDAVPADQLPALASANRWIAKTLRLAAHYAWATGSITAEQRDRALALLASPPGAKRRAITAPLVNAEQAAFTIRWLEAAADKHPAAAIYHAMALVMYYSGARAEEAEHLIRAAPELEPLSHDRALRARGVVDLGGGAVRVALHYNRGRKRCEYLWLPAWLLERARGLDGILRVLEEREGGRVDLSRRMSSFIGNYRKRSPELRQRLLPPKMFRKLHMQALEDLEVPLELREVLQNRYGAVGDVVGLTSYSKALLRADEVYRDRVMPALASRLRGGGAGGYSF